MKNAILALLLVTLVHAVSAQQKKILIVSTNVDSVGNSGSGTYLMEIAYPFQHFTNSGYAVDIVTPKGGKAAIYHVGKKADELAQIEKNELFIQKTKNTLSPDQVKTSDYAAIFYPGGHGQYFDVIDDERIAALATSIYERNGVVGTAGHGAASLINIRLSNCEFLVKGKTITCFPHWAELQFMNISQYGKLLPFDMEEVLARRGANLIVCSKDNRSNKELTHVVDATNRIVTGAFATSAQWVAEQMVELIKASNTK